MIFKAKFHAIIFFLFFCLVSCEKKAEKQEYFTNGVLKRKQIISYKTDIGFLYDYTEDGNLKSESEIKKGKLNGLSKYYYSDGKLEKIEHWRNNRLDGESIEYDEKGNVKYISHLKNGMLHGWRIDYDYKKGISDRFLYDNGEWIYGCQYDERHKINISCNVMPLILSKDTVALNSIYKADVSFAFPLKGNVFITVLLHDATLKVIKFNNNHFQISLKASKKGKQVLPILINHKTDSKDTLSAHGVIIKHGYFVK